MLNFYESSLRHFNDARLLEANNRLPNAAQLYGFSAECGVKALMLVISGSTLTRRYFVHSDQLVNLLQEFVATVNSRFGVHYLTSIQSDFNAFSGCEPWKCQ